MLPLKCQRMVARQQHTLELSNNWADGQSVVHVGLLESFISCSHASPKGGCGALVGRQGGTKPDGRGMAAY